MGLQTSLVWEVNWPGLRQSSVCKLVHLKYVSFQILFCQNIVFSTLAHACIWVTFLGLTFIGLLLSFALQIDCYHQLYHSGLVG